MWLLGFRQLRSDMSMRLKCAPWVLVVALILVASGCANSGLSNPTESPSPSIESTAAWIACGEIKDEIVGLREWISKVNKALDGVPEMSGLDQRERSAANNLLVLHYSFYPEIKDGIMSRAPDIRQQGRGCIESFDQILSAYRGIPIAAAQILACSLNEGIKAVFANQSCGDLFASWNMANAVVRTPLKDSEREFSDPTSVYLQSLRPWMPPTDASSAYERYLSGSEAETCEGWAGAFQVDARVLVSVLENLNNDVYPNNPPIGWNATSPIPAADLTSTTRDLYYGTDKKRQETLEAIFSNFSFAATAPLGAPRTIIGSDPKLQSLNLNVVCAKVNERVDVIGRAADDQIVPGSAGDGLIAKAFEGITLCKSGKFGSDTDACLATRFFGVIPILMSEWQKLHTSFSELSWFIMVSEHGVLP